MPNGEKKYTLRLEIFWVVTRGNNKIIFLTCRTFLSHFEMEDDNYDLGSQENMEVEDVEVDLNDEDDEDYEEEVENESPWKLTIKTQLSIAQVSKFYFYRHLGVFW